MRECSYGKWPRNGAARGVRDPGGTVAGLVCIIHPSQEECRRLAEILASETIDTATFASAEAFLAQVASHGDACVVAPSNLPGMGTRALIELVRGRGPSLRVVVLGHTNDVATAVELVRAGANQYVEPQAPARRLRAAVRNALAACAH